MPDQISPVPPRAQPSFTVEAETPKWPTPRPFWIPERLGTFDGVWQAKPPWTTTLPWLQNASCLSAFAYPLIATFQPPDLMSTACAAGANRTRPTAAKDEANQRACFRMSI